MLQRLSAVSIERLSPQMREFLETSAPSYDERNAEILPGAEPAWYIIEVWPAAERRVADELVARRFGIYIPQRVQTIVKRGRSVRQVGQLFPGYILAFVWDVLEHRSRIERIRGVSRVILDVNGVPLALSDAQIDYIRAVENYQCSETRARRRLVRRRNA